MQKKFIFIVLFLTTITLVARENPFKPMDDAKTSGKTTYKKDTRENFIDQKVKLPSSARILKKVELVFQNLDGSIETKSVDVDKKIDWHDELILKKVNNQEETITAPQTVKPQAKSKKKTNIDFKDTMRLTISGKDLHVKTTDKKIRDFMVTKPHKIVLDFKKEINFYTQIHKLKTKFFKSITIGKHSGYYRVAIELDGKYLYNIEKQKDGFLISLR